MPITEVIAIIEARIEWERKEIRDWTRTIDTSVKRLARRIDNEEDVILSAKEARRTAASTETAIERIAASQAAIEALEIVISAIKNLERSMQS